MLNIAIQQNFESNQEAISDYVLTAEELAEIQYACGNILGTDSRHIGDLLGTTGEIAADYMRCTKMIGQR